MNDVYEVQTVKGPVVASVALPGSKSITNRVLPIAALADGESVLTGVLFSDDSRYFLQALQSLGYQVEIDEVACTVRVVGQGTVPLYHPEGIDIFVGNSGTTARFISAFVSLGHGVYRIDGVKRMRERPIGDLLDALHALGVRASDVLATKCPPLQIDAHGLAGGEASIRASDSSQFLSGLLLAAPYAKAPVRLTVEGKVVSKPYVDMTLAIMQQFGVFVSELSGAYEVVPSHYQARQYAIEPDASGASYFLAAAAITGGCITIEGLGVSSLQGDAQFARVLEQMGCTVTYGDNATTLTGPVDQLQGIDVDLFHMSDLAPTLAAIAPLCQSPVTIKNVANIRLKETDRIKACVIELQKFGVHVEEFPDGMRIYPCASLKTNVTVKTYDDHRMAMAFTILGLRVSGTKIADPTCVAKTFPDFFMRLSKIIQ